MKRFTEDERNEIADALYVAADSLFSIYRPGAALPVEIIENTREKSKMLRALADRIPTGESTGEPE